MEKEKIEIETSITVKELVKILKTFSDDTKVFMSSDSEGNSYSTIDKKYAYGVTEDELSIILYPFKDHLDYEQIDGKAQEMYDRFEKEFEEKRKKSL